MFRVVRVAQLRLAVVLAMMGMIMPLSAQAAEIYLYADENFTGATRHYFGDVRNLALEDFNDRATSIRIVSGTWTVCKDASFDGRCEVIRENIANLSTAGLNDVISSIRVETGNDSTGRNGPGDSWGWYGPASENNAASNARNERWIRDRIARWERWEANQTYRAEVFEDRNYRGTHHAFSGAIPDMRRYGLNNRISSFRLEGRWQVCERENFSGNCEIYRFDESNLVQSGWNDRIMSMRPMGAAGQNRADLLLFEDADFRGDRERFSESEPDLRSRGFDNTASSVQIRDGRWELCADRNYRGRCRQVDANRSNLSPLSLNDQVSSVRRLDGGGNNDSAQSGYGDDSIAPSTTDRADAITIYEHTNYGGRSLTFTGDVPTLVQQNFNDDLSSFRIRGGRWQLCEDTNFQGRCWIFDGDEANAVTLGFNDRISSLRRVDGDNSQDTAQITIYADTSYAGRSLTFTTDTMSLVPHDFNDNLSSFRIRGGRWQLCEDTNFQGRCWIFDGDEANAVTLGFNDRISSLRRVDGGGSQDTAQLVAFEDANYRGSSHRFSGSSSNLAPGGWNDRISSFRISGPGRWEICEHSSFGGRCQIFGSDVASLVPLDWNDRVSSIRYHP